METNQETKKIRKKFPIALVICLAIVLVCGGVTIAAIVSRNTSSKEELVMTDKMEANDEETLRKLLMAEGTCEITITNDITVKEELLVNGTKTIRGKKSIIMDTGNVGKGQSVLAVVADARLTLDGATIDGNGTANAVLVKSRGEFTCLSGNLVWGYPYGLQVTGTATVKDITVEHAMHTSVYVDIGGKLDMQGGELKDAAIAHLATASGSNTSISGDVKIYDSNGYLVYNYGKMDITGGTYHGSHMTAMVNYGELNVTGTENKYVEIYDSEATGIYHVKGTKFDMNYVSVHDTANQGIQAEKKSTGSIRNTTVERPGKSGIYVNNSKVAFKNITISGGKSYGFFAQNHAEVELEDMTVKDMESRGMANDNSTVTGKNITIMNTGKTGYYANGEKPVNHLENVKLIKSGTSALGITTGSTSVKNITIEESTNEGVYVGEKATVNVEDVTVKKAGTHGVANRGGKLIMKNAKISASTQCALTLTKGSDNAINDAALTDTGWQAVNMQNESTATIHNVDINKTGKAAVYVQNARLSLKNANVTGAATYGVYVEKSPKDANRGVFLDNVTIKAPGDRGFGNMASYMVITNAKVSDSKGAGVYARGAAAITNMNQVVLTNPGASGFGLVGGTVTGRNLTVIQAKNEGVYIGKDAKAKLDNVVVQDAGLFGIGNYGGILNITVDKKYNPDNITNNGVTILNPAKKGIYAEGGETTIACAKISAVSQQAVSIQKNSVMTIDQCSIKGTGQAGVRVSESKLTLKNTRMENVASYGVYVEKSAKKDGKVVNLENIDIIKPGERGIGNIGSYMVMKNITVTESKGAGVYTSGEESITNMHKVTVTSPGASGLGFTAGTVTARNVTVENSKGEGIHVGEKANVKVDNVMAADSKNHGVINYGTLNITVDKSYNPDNTKGNGITIKNPNGAGIVLYTGKVTGQGVTIQDTKGQGIVLKKDTEFTGDGVTIQNVSTYGIEIPEGAAANLSDTNIAKTGQDGINTAGTLNITPDAAKGNGVTVNNAGNHGIYVGGGVTTADHVTITGTEKMGLNMQGKSNVKVSNLAVSAAKTQGIYVAKDGTKAEITGFEVKDTGSAAVRIMNKTNVTLADGVVSTKTYGIYMSNASDTTATNVKVERLEGNKDTLVVVADTAKLTMGNNDNGESGVDGKKLEGRGVEVQGTFILNGGNIINQKVTSNVGSSLVTANKTDGAGIYVLAGGNVTMNGGKISGNVASAAAGGGVSLNGKGAAFTLNDGNIQDNSATFGGAVMARAGTFTMNGGKLADNNATNNGGAIYLKPNYHFTMKGGTITGNKAANQGGAICAEGNSTITLEAGKIADNTAKTGNAVRGNGNKGSLIIYAGFEINKSDCVSIPVTNK